MKRYLNPKEGTYESILAELQTLQVKPLDPLSDQYKIDIILKHRKNFKVFNKIGLKQPFASDKLLLKPKMVKDIFCLKPIFFKDMDPTNDRVYEEFAIKLTIIEDPLLGEKNKFVALIGRDDSDDVRRIFVYDYSGLAKTIGFGSRITIFNPYCLKTVDGASVLRVDKSLVFVHPNQTDPSMCRFCGRRNGEVQCLKCEAYYCSEDCLQKDELELKHELVCVK